MRLSTANDFVSSNRSNLCIKQDVKMLHSVPSAMTTKERFNMLLPKYGKMWKMMADAAEKQPHEKNQEIVIGLVDISSKENQYEPSPSKSVVHHTMITNCDLVQTSRGVEEVTNSEGSQLLPADILNESQRISDLVSNMCVASSSSATQENSSTSQSKFSEGEVHSHSSSLAVNRCKKDLSPMGASCDELNGVGYEFNKFSTDDCVISEINKMSISDQSQVDKDANEKTLNLLTTNALPLNRIAQSGSVAITEKASMIRSCNNIISGGENIPSLMNAILQKQSVCLRVCTALTELGTKCECDSELCEHAPPILEVVESNNSDEISFKNALNSDDVQYISEDMSTPGVANANDYGCNEEHSDDDATVQYIEILSNKGSGKSFVKSINLGKVKNDENTSTFIDVRKALTTGCSTNMPIELNAEYISTSPKISKCFQEGGKDTCSAITEYENVEETTPSKTSSFKSSNQLEFCNNTDLNPEEEGGLTTSNECRNSNETEYNETKEISFGISNENCNNKSNEQEQAEFEIANNDQVCDGAWNDRTMDFSCSTNSSSSANSSVFPSSSSSRGKNLILSKDSVKGTSRCEDRDIKSQRMLQEHTSSKSGQNSVVTAIRSSLLSSLSTPCVNGDDRYPEALSDYNEDCDESPLYRRRLRLSGLLDGNKCDQRLINQRQSVDSKISIENTDDDESCTSEEEWNEDICESSTSSSTSESIVVKGRSRRKGETSFDVIIVSDDDLEWFESSQGDTSDASDVSSVEKNEGSNEIELSLTDLDYDKNVSLNVDETGEEYFCDDEVEGRIGEFDVLPDENHFIVKEHNQDDINSLKSENLNAEKNPNNTSAKRGVSGISRSIAPAKNISRLSFKRQRDELTTAVFHEFNKTAFQSNLTEVNVEWSKKLQTTAGLTRLKQLGKHKRKATIELSTKVIDDNERLRATLLHEMCHAAAWLLDGVHTPPHGKNFKKWATIAMKKIKNVSVTTRHDYEIAYKFAWACTNEECGAVIKRQSRSVQVEKHCCASCKGKLIEIEVPTRGQSTKAGLTPKVKRDPSGFSLFVKENSRSVRQQMIIEANGMQVKQSAVMQECGRLWHKIKNDKLKSRDQNSS